MCVGGSQNLLMCPFGPMAPLVTIREMGHEYLFIPLSPLSQPGFSTAFALSGLFGPGKGGPYRKIMVKQ